MRMLLAFITLAVLAALAVWLGKRGKMLHRGCTCRSHDECGGHKE